MNKPLQLKPNRKSYISGFTLVEFFLVLLVTGVLVSIAVPSYLTMVKSNRITAQSNAFLGTFLIARSEAVKRGETVTVCQSGNGSACQNASDWHDGWIMFEDGNNDGVRSSGEALVRVGDALDGSNLIFSSSNGISFNQQGLADAFNQFEICDGDPAYEDRFFKVLMVNQTGRAKLSDTTATGGTPTCD